MKHLGDITKINGAEVPPVNVIIGGSPCQDLSVAGKRAGLAGERSGLFMEQIRIIKEMRKADADRGRTGKDIRPRYMVWENVPGAFSSNKGADFGAVLQETVKVVDGQAPAVPMPVKGWPLAGCLYGDGGGFSIAWRVFDAQFWGVPQRRRRIALVADFGGLTAPEILFERESVSGDFTTGGEQRQGIAGSPEESPESANGAICIQGNSIDRADTAGCNGRGWTEDVSYTLNTIDRPAVLPFTNRGLQSGEKTETLRAQSHGAILMIAEGVHQNADGDLHTLEDKAYSLSTNGNATGRNSPLVAAGFCAGNSPAAGGIGYQEEVSPTIRGAASGTNQIPAVFSFDSLASNSMKSSNPHSGCREVDKSKTLDCFDPNPAKNQGGIAIVQPLTYPDIANTLTSRNDGSPQPDKGNGASIIAFAQNQRDEVRDLNGKAGALAAEPGMKQQTYIADVYAIGNGQADQTGLHAVAGTLNCMHDQQALLFENHPNDSRVKGPIDICTTVSSRYGTGGGNTPLVADPMCGVTSGQQFTGRFTDRAETLRARDYKEPQAVCMAVDRRNATESDINGTMQAKANGGFSYNCNQVVRSGYAVRRLTPTECERLQGFPDGWTDIGDYWFGGAEGQNGKLRHTSDALRYKALGNSIALPSWCYVLQRLSICCGTDITMASLFDGIGGFPLIWEYLNGKGSCIWASEIEAFPIAVTRKHFPETK